MIQRVQNVCTFSGCVYQLGAHPFVAGGYGAAACHPLGAGAAYPLGAA